MDTRLFDFYLPPELIAQEPPSKRTDSRLLVVDRATGGREHKTILGILDYLRPGDGLVVNNTKVFKARMWGRRKTGGKVEVFLVKRAESQERGVDQWEAMVSPSSRLRVDEQVCFNDDLSMRLVRYLTNGRWLVDFGSVTRRNKIISSFGHVPLPPYIRRQDGALDRRRYQTVYASESHQGAVAAPTAGLHFTQGLLTRIKRLGVSLIEVTLHVGPGTFKPVRADQIEDHKVDPEFAEVTPRAAAQINRVKEKGGAIFAVGTTSVRTIESAPWKDKTIQPFSGMVDLYIQPGYKFRRVDHMLTNFHLPKSSLLILVSAFMGREQVLSAYEDAIVNRYRFYSYGDAMLVL